MTATSPCPPRQGSDGSKKKKKNSPRAGKQRSVSQDVIESDGAVWADDGTLIRNGNTACTGGGGGGKIDAFGVDAGATALSKKAYKARKKLAECEALRAKAEAGAALNADQRAKLASLPERKAALAEVEAVLAAEEAARAATALEKAAALQATLRVEFDDAFACGICQDVLEAATLVKTCKHVFCRGCIEDLIVKSTKKAHCVCPLCRAPLYQEGACGVVERIELKPAKDVKKRMTKKTGLCHCGETVPLHKLRAHLRSCGSAANHYVDQRKFTCDYVRPDFSEDAPVMSTDAEVEQAMRLSLSTYFDELHVRESAAQSEGAGALQR